jgi:hypothetical protein
MTHCVDLANAPEDEAPRPRQALEVSDVDGCVSAGNQTTPERGYMLLLIRPVSGLDHISCGPLPADPA